MYNTSEHQSMSLVLVSWA